uniref:Kinesin motor domain-containing protein n=1 Tax=Physcomitrium patens TaxID=3218 RepID=A0A7I4BD30_PHYPA
MKGILSRARSSPRGGGDALVKEKEPFNVGPYRSKSASPGRKPRNNSENVPPDSNAHAAEGMSPVQCKAGMSKASKSSKEMFACNNNSPALPPKPPRPSPARNGCGPTQFNDKSHGHDQGGNIKRKINWDMHTDNATAASETSSADTGVKVIVRVRPLNKKEEAEEAEQVVHRLSATGVSLADQLFTYDAVAGEDASQEAVFHMVGLPMVENCLAGFNSSIFAYGQTGSGKTHTMWGVMSESEDFPSEGRGLTPRVFEKLFARIDEEERINADKQLVYQCRCSFLEIYNEQITDLLEPSLKNLMIREDTKSGVYVDNLSEEFVSSVQDVTRILIKGLANRRVGATTMNSESSRSHSVFTCVIESRSKSEGEGISSVRSSKLNLVDLAGSERQKQTGSAGERLKEAGNINKSLSQLGNVINILAEVAQSGKHRHIPYRDSRLTFLLQESLGGNAKLAMICAVSPASSCKNETLGTLRFAQRAKVIRNKAVINEEKANDVNLLREQIRQLKDELTRMKSNSGAEAADGSGYSTGWNARRSYNLLRLSLGHPMKAPLLLNDDNDDDDMELDDDMETTLNAMAVRLSQGTGVSQSTDMELGSPKLRDSCKVKSSGSEEGNDQNIRTLALGKAVEDTPSIESPTTGVVNNANGNLLALDVPDAPSNFGAEAIPDVKTVLRNSMSMPSPSPRDRLAASLQKGLQILDLHQKSSLRRSTNIRFSFQSDPKSLREPEKEPVGMASICSKCQLRSSMAGVRSSFQIPNPNKKPLSLEAGVQVSPPKALSKSAELAAFLEIGCKTMLPDSPDSSLEMSGDSKSENKVLTPRKPEYAQAIEALLAGSIRREREAEEVLTQQASEIEQLNRLVRHYKHERECNAVIQQSREEKIVRLEALMAGVLPRETFLSEEWAALLHEHKTLQEKFDKHPEVTHSKMELERLLDELGRYKTFFDLGEREVLLQENMDLRNHLQTYLECDTPGPAKQRRLSLTSKAIRESAAGLSLRTTVSHCPLESGDAPETDQLAIERRLWQERELEWLTLMEEMQSESEKYRLLAEKRKVELDGEKRCAKEVQEALQMAMEGHARQLEQYAELQEKHISLLGKNRKIREGLVDLKKLAKKAGVTTTDTRWFECQAEQLVAMRIDHELERDAAKEEAAALQAQLQDTVEAVAAAGELLVRLKEAEEAVCMAQDAAAMAGQEANRIHREMEKLKRKHEAELAAVQQSLLETRMQKPQLCPMCVMAERVKFEFTEVEPETTARTESKSNMLSFRSLSTPGLGPRSSWNSGPDGSCAKDDEEESIAGELEDRGLLLENLDFDEFVDEPL